MEYTTFGAVTILVYCIVQFLKLTKLDSKWYPVLAGVSGGILGIICMYLMPNYPAKDIISALITGILSGLAATGSNQVFKQLSADKSVEYADEEGE